MFKLKNKRNAPTGGVITSKGGLGKRTIVLIVIVVIILLIGGGVAAAYIGHVGPFAPKASDSGSGTATPSKPSTPTEVIAAHQAAVTKMQTQIDTLVASGDKQSIAQADQVAESQVTTANESGDADYIISASLTKADLMINTGRAQEALDSVLLPLNDTYGNNDTYKFEIDSYIGSAYYALGNQAEANEYYALIPEAGSDQ